MRSFKFYKLSRLNEDELFISALIQINVGLAKVVIANFSQIKS